MGYGFEELQDMIKDMVEELPLTVESMNKMKTQQLVNKLRLEVDRYRTYILRKCRTRRVFLETNYKQLPKKQIQQLEDMAEINED